MVEAPLSHFVSDGITGALLRLPYRDLTGEINVSMFEKKLLCCLALAFTGCILKVHAHELHEPLQDSAVTAEASFIAENNTAMEKMMADMGATPTGNIDRDFVTSMSAHHQGAIDMAVTLLKYGQNEQLKRMAQEIIVDQQQEIAAMRQALGDPLPPSVASPTQPLVSKP
ncbi:DUF305 domain-containing protein [Pseudomonas sp. R3-56]|uniref:DUF305 domain-containing protein n=1 Tax=Pseudomonas sp. R3-56 TaxID=2817401 RepID=UPI003DA87ACC